MSATLKTENYDLPYFAESDDTDWTAYNDSVNKVDEVMKQNATEAGEAKTVAGEANSNATTAVEQVTELTEKVSTNTSNIADATNKVSGLQTTVENLETHMNDVDTEIETAKTDISNNTRNISAALNNIDTLSATVTQNKRDTDATLQNTNNTLNIVKERAQNNENNITALATEQQTMSGEIAKNEADIVALKSSTIQQLDPAVTDITITTTINNLQIHVPAKYSGQVFLINGTSASGDFTPTGSAEKNGFLVPTVLQSMANHSLIGSIGCASGSDLQYKFTFNNILVVSTGLADDAIINIDLWDYKHNSMRFESNGNITGIRIARVGLSFPSSSRLLLNSLYGTNVINAYDAHVDTDSDVEEDTTVMTKSKTLPEI